jgi:hypothetical protein
MKLQMKREALDKLNRKANELAPANVDALMSAPLFEEMCTSRICAQFVHSRMSIWRRVKLTSPLQSVKS